MKNKKQRSVENSGKRRLPRLSALQITLIAFFCIGIAGAGCLFFLYKGFLVYFKNTKIELENTRAEICRNETGYFNNGPVKAEGYLRDSELMTGGLLQPDEIHRLLVERRFMYIEEVAGSAKQNDVGFRKDIEGESSKYFRYYLSEEGDHACYPLAIEASGSSSSNYRADLPNNLCIAAIRIDTSISPYFLEDGVSMQSKSGFKVYYYGLHEVGTGKAIAEFRDLVLTRGSTRSGSLTCAELQNRRDEAFAELTAVRAVLEPADTTQFLDIREVPIGSPVREFYKLSVRIAAEGKL